MLCTASATTATATTVYSECPWGELPYLDVGSGGPSPMLVRRDVVMSEHAAWLGPDRNSRAPERAKAN